VHKIGVFDSGVGGEKVVKAIQGSIPDATVVFRDDRKHLPYGDKTPAQMLEFMSPIMNSFLNEDRVDAIVIACNTASTNVLRELQAMSSVPVVGFVPMIKPASQLTRTGVITVCATPGTLKSDRYHELKREFGSNLTILEPDCSNWASLIEKNEMNTMQLHEVISKTKEAGGDVIVLGCTHYHWIEEELIRLAGEGIRVVQPTEPVIAQLKRVLSLPVPERNV